MIELSKFSACVIIFYFVALCEAQENCQKIDVCSCKFKNGSEVNLWPTDGDNNPRFPDIKGEKDRTFLWNPCTPFNYEKGCTNTMVCQKLLSNEFDAGSNDSKFSLENGNVVLTYGAQKGTDGHMRKSKIILKCDLKAPGNGTIDKITQSSEGATSVYTGTFISSYACPKGGKSSSRLSTGSILLIVFFPLLLLYIVAGILINYHGRGVRSVPEMLPNYSFWTDFPFLVKDGAVLSYGAVKSACFSIYGKFKKDGYAEI
ncbi:uncharacterized protein LOC141881522 [Acropora palmata]|uniref:uncharacterized protein LOC141881522 n=1 Tax=Acropora palmata TaxID=6131 RepID=UPI003DA02690